MSKITITKDGKKTIVNQAYFGEPRLKKNILATVENTSVENRGIYRDVLAKIATSIIQKKLSVTYIEIHILSELLKKVNLFKLSIQLKCKATSWHEESKERLKRRGLYC